MGNQARQLLEAALALPKDERADLAEQLLASVEDEVTDADMFGETEPDPDIEKAWAAEITRRAERALRGETVGIPGSEVDAQIRRIIEGK
jgi:putative addiction module component (TIGR02574 family)